MTEGSGSWIEGPGSWIDRYKLLEEIGRVYAPFLLANADALQRGAPEVGCTIDGRPWTQRPFPYQGKCLQALRAAYAGPVVVPAVARVVPVVAVVVPAVALVVPAVADVPAPRANGHTNGYTNGSSPLDDFIADKAVRTIFGLP